MPHPLPAEHPVLKPRDEQGQMVTSGLRCWSSDCSYPSILEAYSVSKITNDTPRSKVTHSPNLGE